MEGHAAEGRGAAGRRRLREAAAGLGAKPGAAWDAAAVLWLAVLAAAFLVMPALRYGTALGPFDLGNAMSGLGHGLYGGVHNGWLGDQIEEILPWNTFDWRHIHQLRLPLWNPDSLLGLPQFFNFQSAVLSLPDLVGYAFPLRLSFLVAAVGKLLLAGSGAYLFCRVAGCGRAGAVLAGTAFELSGPFASEVGWPVADVFAWLGWVFAFTWLVCRGGRPRRDVALLAVSVAFAVYGGFPEAVILLAGAALVFTPMLLLRQPGDGDGRGRAGAGAGAAAGAAAETGTAAGAGARSGGRDSGGRAAAGAGAMAGAAAGTGTAAGAGARGGGRGSGGRAAAAVWLAGGWCSGLGLAAPLWLPGAQLIALSARYGVRHYPTLPLRTLPALLLQGYYGYPTWSSVWFGPLTYYETVGYVGVVVAVLAAVAVAGAVRGAGGHEAGGGTDGGPAGGGLDTRVGGPVGRASRRPSAAVWPLAVTALAMGAVAYGPDPFRLVAAVLPGAGGIVAGRARIPLAFTLCCLAGFGLRDLLDAATARAGRAEAGTSAPTDPVAAAGSAAAGSACAGPAGAGSAAAGPTAALSLRTCFAASAAVAAVLVGLLARTVLWPGSLTASEVAIRLRSFIWAAAGLASLGAAGWVLGTACRPPAPAGSGARTACPAGSGAPTASAARSSARTASAAEMDARTACATGMGARTASIAGMDPRTRGPAGMARASNIPDGAANDIQNPPRDHRWRAWRACAPERRRPWALASWTRTLAAATSATATAAVAPLRGLPGIGQPRAVAAGLLVATEAAFLLTSGVALNTYSHRFFPTTAAERALERIVQSGAAGAGGSGVAGAAGAGAAGAGAAGAGAAGAGAAGAGAAGAAAGGGPVGFAPTGRGVGGMPYGGLGLIPEMNVAYRIPEMGAYDPLVPAAYRRAWSAETGAPPDPGGWFVPTFASAGEARVWGVPYVLGPGGGPAPPGMVPVAALGGEELYRVPGAGRFTLEGARGSGSGGGARTAGRIGRVVRVGDATWDLRVEVARPARLLVRLTAVPGWHATVDGRPAALRRWHGVMQRLDLPPGVHEVRLWYWPRLFTWGLALCAAAAAGLAAGCVRRRREGRAVAPTEAG